MPTLDKLQESHSTTQSPPATLDEVGWEAWRTKGRLQEERRSRVRVEVVKAASIVGLLAAAALWSYVAPYEIAVRFAVAAASIFVMFQALRSRHYVLAALFGALVLLYNPIVPVFNASDDLQRFLLAISSTPFIVSLGWKDARQPV